MHSRLRAILTERSLVFLFSLTIATGLWYFVKDGARQVTVPGRPGAVVYVQVILEGVPDGLQAAAEPAEIAVEEEGPRGVIGTIKAGDVRVAVDATALGPGTHRASLRVTTPAQVRVVAVRPSEVVVRVRRM